MALQPTDILPLYRITDSSNRKISVADFSTYIQTEAGKLAKPGREGTFVIVEDADGNISYDDYAPIEAIDGGEYAVSASPIIWSNFCTGNTIGVHTLDKAFDGITSGLEQECIPANGQTVTFQPPKELNGDIKIHLRMGSNSQSSGSLIVEGFDYTALVNIAWTGSVDDFVVVDIPNNILTPSKGITWKRVGFNDFIGISGIEVGGQLLIDGVTFG